MTTIAEKRSGWQTKEGHLEREKRKKSIEDFQVTQKNDEVVSLETKIRFIIT